MRWSLDGSEHALPTRFGALGRSGVLVGVGLIVVAVGLTLPGRLLRHDPTAAGRTSAPKVAVCGNVGEPPRSMLVFRPARTPGLFDGEREALGRLVRSRDPRRVPWWLGGAGIGLIVVGASVRRQERVRLGVDGVSVGSVTIPRSEVHTVLVRGDRLVVTTADRTVRTARLRDPDILGPALAAWRRLDPAQPPGAPDPALASLRQAGRIGAAAFLTETNRESGRLGDPCQRWQDVRSGRRP